MPETLKKIKFEERCLCLWYVNAYKCSGIYYIQICVNFIILNLNAQQDNRRDLNQICKKKFLQTILISSLSSTSVAMVAQITSDDRDHNKKQYLFA